VYFINFMMQNTATTLLTRATFADRTSPKWWCHSWANCSVTESKEQVMPPQQQRQNQQVTTSAKAAAIAKDDGCRNRGSSTTE
jgi:hypothetical protein